MENEKKEIVRYENVADQVLARIKSLQSVDALHLPKNYAVDNALKAAWLILQDVEDKAHNKALDVCTKQSIANAMLNMVLQGLSVAKNQGYFLVYGKQLAFQRSYFGSIALAKRTGAMDGEPVAQVIYKGDDFVYTIKDGNIEIVKHDQKLENINANNIVGAYAIVKLANGESRVTLMTIEQIRNAWNQSPTRGQSPAHKNFPEEMCKKTAIGRACKQLINTSDDGWILDGEEDVQDAPKASRDDEVKQMAAKTDFAEPVDFEDVAQPKLPTEETTPTEAETEDVPY